MTMVPTDPVVPQENVADLLDAMSRTGFQGRRLGESFKIWQAMIGDPDCTILLGLSGAMIPAGMQRCLMTLAERHYIDAIVSTGANIFHDLCEHFGIHHYQGHHHVDDGELFRQGIDRIYDIFAFEEEFRGIDARIASFAREIAPFSGSSTEFVRKLGEFAAREQPEGKSLIATCFREEIPVFVPALADSSIGIGLVMARRDGVAVDVDQLADADQITRFVEGAATTGVIFIGGGVPKNFIQQTQVIASIHEAGLHGHAYAIQFTTDAPHWGGLSGCTFEEAISWGKETLDCPRVQVFCDATIALPLVTSALFARDVKRKRK
ncbi:MAG TPA: deoxyhypusine synthase [Methanoregulaceae archaeon]|nr:deoxyhypusine synthase [Methanoregulaceae archaeon]HPD09884.1 deoxyhypusine synthase [Methanoregulaceae archaeon]HRT14925.1 deoxyhypusine synthase [Methanoregulaceae archaeon]HRU30460.1 deoxyhypusine synthase [Methanoregulaceae archaeon]